MLHEESLGPVAGPRSGPAVWPSLDDITSPAMEILFSGAVWIRGREGKSRGYLHRPVLRRAWEPSQGTATRGANGLPLHRLHGSV